MISGSRPDLGGLPARSEAALTVLCITGWCRNGSTIIGNILNEAQGFFHVGELHFLWKNAAGLGANNRCGCGSELGQCPFWSAILPLGRPSGVPPAGFAAEVVRRQRACVRTRHTWRVLRRGLDSDDIRAHAALMTQVYRVVAERSGAGVIVDTSKMPGEAALLPYLDGLRPLFVHLVRDPRAVAQSWREPKQYVDAMPASVSTAYWHGFDLAARAITRAHADSSMLLRYEEFMADPVSAIERLLRFCAADPAVNPMTGRTVELRANHTVTGNPDRFRIGATFVRSTDDAWRAGLPGSARLAATALSWPTRRRYGYSGRGTLAAGPTAEDTAADDTQMRSATTQELTLPAARTEPHA